MRSASRPLRSPAGGPAGGFAAPFVVPGSSGVAVRDRLKHLTARDEMVLRAVGAHLGALASRDLKTRCADGLGHDGDRWAARKRAGGCASCVAGSAWPVPVTIWRRPG